MSKKTGLPAADLKRFLRLAMTRHIFAETSPNSGIIKHSAASALFIKEPMWRDWLGHCLEEAAPSAFNLAKTIKTVGVTDDPSKCAIAETFFKDHPTYKSTFDWFDNDGEGAEKGFRVKRFSRAMGLLGNDPTFRIDHLLHLLYDWNSLGDATLVDVSIIYYRMTSC
jgi:6-hydroxytryprostatin B O-methyltransferase